MDSTILLGFIGVIVTILAVGVALAGLILKLNNDTNRRINGVENRLTGVESRLVEVEKSQARMEGFLAVMQGRTPPSDQ